MMRVLVFGSSHVAALRSGWMAVQPEFPEITLDFMAIPQPDIHRYGRGEGDLFGLIDKAGLHPKRLAMIDEFSVARQVHLASYDHVLLAGINLSVHVMQRACRLHGIEGLRPAPRPDAALLSRAFFRAMCADCVEHLLLASMVPFFAGFPVTVLQAPRRSELLTSLEQEFSIDARDSAEHPEGLVECLDIYEAIATEVLQSQGIHYRRQPPETVGAFGFTKLEYSRGNISMSSNREHTQDIDTAHMNADYGAIILRDALAAIASLSAQADETAEAEAAPHS